MQSTLAADEFVAIQQLVGKYQWLVDEGEGDEWAALYATDGSFIREGVEPVVGREALKQIPIWVKTQWKGALRHHSGSVHIEAGANPNEAKVRYYNFVTIWTDGKPEMFSFALSKLQLVKADGVWRIKTHLVKELNKPREIGAAD